jgi:hypothetical protein
VYDPQEHLRVARGQRLPYNATPERFVDAHVRRLEALASRGLVTREDGGRFRVPADLLVRLEDPTAPARDSAFIKVDVHGRDLRRQADARAFTWLDDQLVAGIPQLRQVTVRTRFQDELIQAAEQRIQRLVQLGLAQVGSDGLRLDPALRAKLARLERSDIAARLRGPHGRYVEFDGVQRFTGRVAGLETSTSGVHAVVVSGDRFTIIPADRSLAEQVGKAVSLTHSPTRDAEQARVRFRVLDSLDLSPSLGR